MKPSATKHAVYLSLLLIAACSNVAESNKAAAQSLTRWKNDTGKAWTNLFSYNPEPQTPKLASTRYCYQFASDVVCYDNPQPHLTSRIVGVQGGEGPRMVVHQPPRPSRFYQSSAQPLFPSDVNATSQPVLASPNVTNTNSVAMPSSSPFAAAKLPPKPGPSVVNGKDIQSADLPAPTKKP